MAGTYIYLAIIILVFVFLAVKITLRHRRDRKNYEEREDNVFYDAVKKIRKD